MTRPSLRMRILWALRLGRPLTAQELGRMLTVQACSARRALLLLERRGTVERCGRPTPYCPTAHRPLRCWAWAQYSLKNTIHHHAGASRA